MVVGFLCAFAHAISYLFSRHFTAGSGRTSGQLIAIAHIIMGALSLCALPWLWRTPEAGWASAAVPLVATAGFYLAAQVCLFQALRVTESSRVAPLLGLKIVFLALLVTTTGSESVTMLQWAAVLCAVISVYLLNSGGSGEGVPRSGLLWLLGACLGYSLSDFHIPQLIHALREDGGIREAVHAVALTYTVCGAVGLVLYIVRHRSSSRADWAAAVPFAISWFAAMIFLFAAMAFVGVVLAVILQSTRGLLAILLAVLVSGWGYEALERKTTWTIRLRQVGAALLMIGAIALYRLGEPTVPDAVRHRGPAGGQGAGGTSFQRASRRLALTLQAAPTSWAKREMRNSSRSHRNAMSSRGKRRPADCQAAYSSR
jgi:drug/metabolite transporter (DMT)-like permease